MRFLLWTLLLNKLATRFLFLESHGHRPLNKQLDRELIRSSPRYGIGPGNWEKKGTIQSLIWRNKCYWRCFPWSWWTDQSLLYPWVLELEFTWVGRRGLGLWLENISWNVLDPQNYSSKMSLLRCISLRSHNANFKQYQIKININISVIN